MVTHRPFRAFAGSLVFMIAVVWSTTVWAQTPTLPAAAVVSAPADSDTASSAVRLLVGRSTLLDVGAPITRVSLTSPDIADAIVTTPEQLLINGKAPGTISMFVWERAGSIRRYEIVVQRDLARLDTQLKQLFPGESIDAYSNGKDIVLAGLVTSKEIADHAADVAAGYVDKHDQIVSLIRVQEPERSNQVLLHVRFAEVSRNALTELGASFFTGANGYKNVVGRTTTQQFSAPTFDNNGPSGNELVFNDYLNLFLFDMKHQLGTVIHALQSKGLFQSLAEPNLVAESGKEASFLAGGEIPIPIAQPTGGGVTVSVQYKEFGIRLNFTPIVNGDRVHLKVRPEVSSLDFANGVVLQGFRIPALTTRRAETELELMDGQTFAIAGLLNNTVSSTMQKIPGIGDIPILGLLFRSKSAQKDRTELVVMITPQILPRNSSGVTTTLPRIPERFLPPVPPNKSFEQPPPAFPRAPGDQRPAAAAPAGGSAPSPSTAAAAVSALTPRAPQVVQPSADVPTPEGALPTAVAPGAPPPAPRIEPRASGPQTAAPVPAGVVPTEPAVTSIETGQPAAAAEAVPSTEAPAVAPADAVTPVVSDAPAQETEPAARPLTREEQKRMERARTLEREKAAADERARIEQEKKAAKQAEADRKKAEKEVKKERERQEKLAREQARRDAEAARSAQEDARKQAERDREHQKELDAAAARLHDAQMAYEAELAKTKGKKP